MIWSSDSIPNQTGRIAFITGANSGLGFDTAKALLQKDSTVILGCRSIEKAEIAKKKLLDEVNYGKIELLKIDLSDLTEVNRAGDEILTNFQKLDIIINNAGVMAPPRRCSKQGYEIQFAVNHLSHMALTLKLLPLLAATPRARAVTVSSGAQYMGKIMWNDIQGEKDYDRWRSYSQSKLANIMFSLELDKRLKESNIGVASLSAHPGLARTNLQPTSIAANKSWQEAIAYKLMTPMFQSSSMGALPQLCAATDPNAKSGEQYGPRFNFRGYPKLCPAAKLALENQDRIRLWLMSEELIGDLVDINHAKKIFKQIQ